MVRATARIRPTCSSTFREVGPGVGPAFQPAARAEHEHVIVASPGQDTESSQPNFLELYNLGDGATSRVPLPGRIEGRLHTRWSPDGRYVAYVAGNSRNNEAVQLWVHRISDGYATAVTDELTENWSPSWSPDSRAVYFVSNRGGSMDLWRQSLDSGEPQGDPQRVTTGVGMRQAIFSPDGRRLAYGKGGRVANVWRVPLLEDRPATWADAKQLTFDEALIEWIDVTPDGSSMLLSSNRSGNQDLWRLRCR